MSSLWMQLAFFLTAVALLGANIISVEDKDTSIEDKDIFSEQDVALELELAAFRRYIAGIKKSMKRVRRAVDVAINPERLCRAMNCGYTIYTPMSRTIEYSLKNTCRCPNETYKCVRYRDNMSVNAFLYKCKQNATADDIELPGDAI